MAERKVCYILINYNERTYRHYLYLYELLRDVSKRHDMALLIEECHGTPDFPDMREVHVLSTTAGLAGRWELLKTLWGLYRRGYTVFYSHYSYRSALAASLITRLFGGEVYFWHCIMVEHLLAELHQLRGRSPLMLLSNALFRLRLRLTIRAVSFIVSGSPFMTSYYQRHFGATPEGSLPLANWIRPERFSLPDGRGHLVREELDIPEDHQIVLYVHGLVRGKGAHRLPRIAFEVLAEEPKVTFIIIGDGPARPYMEQEARRLGVDGNLRMLGHVENSLVGKYYEAATLFILPSMFDAFTRVVLEAMYCGAPFVATDGGGGVRAYTSAMQQEQILTWQQIDHFPRKILELLRSPERRRRLIAEGRRQVSLYTHEHAVARFEHHIIHGHREPLDATGVAVRHPQRDPLLDPAGS